MTGQSGAASDRVYETVTDETVAQKELDEIRYRRHEASTSGRAEVRVDRDSNEEIQHSLTGLAFSGGGIRSGAICLGVLKALRRTRLLWFFDYLSTVSGGGYAGAYLSSAALCTTRAGALKYENQDGTESAASESAESSPEEAAAGPVPTDDDSNRVLKALHGEEKQSERMQDFIFGGHYLIRTRRFLNRYLMGTSLLWALTFSALASMALILSLMFRSMDSDGVRDWLAGLGFRTDIPRGLFPAFCLALLWFTCWSVSYFRDGSHAKGKRASYVLTLFFLAVGVAVAALLGNGEFGSISWLSSNGSDGFFSEHLREFARLALYGFIGVGLIPYLRPSRFIQSGAKPKKASERVIFALSSRVLVYGVPFLLVSWFAMENVSGWSETRATPKSMNRAMQHAAEAQSKPEKDSDKENSDNQPDKRTGQDHRQEVIALAHAEVKDWKSRSPAWAPLWSQLRHAQKVAAEKKTDEKSSDGQLEVEDRKPHPGFFIWGQIHDRRINCEHNGLEFDTLELAIDSLHKKLELSRRLFNRSRDGKSNTMVERVSRRSYALATYLPDWWRSSTDSWHSVPNDFDDGPRNPIRQLANLRQNIRDIKEAITAHLDYQLKTALLDKCDWELRVKELEADSDKEAAKQLSAALRKAEHFYQAHDLDTFQESTADWNAETWLKLAMINRELVAAAWPDTITDREVVFASAVQGPDQAWRFNWLLCSLAVFALLALVVNVNATGLHGFYSRGLAENWIEPVPGIGRQIPLARLATTSEGLPYHLIMASVHWLGRRNKHSGDLQRDSFLFSKLFCGCRKSGYVDSKDYMEGDITLPDAIAVSGAAVSPVQQGNPLVKALLWLANVRLGQWLENPRFARVQPLLQFIDRRTITPLRLLVSSWRRAEERPHYFVSDGGHHENLGVGTLFERRCRFILSIDASQDQEYEFADLATLIRWARVKHGVVLEPVPLDKPDELSKGIGHWNQLSPEKADSRLDEKRLAERHFVLLRIHYPDRPKEEGSWLVYVKASLTGDEPVDLLRYAERDEDFPHNSTADQFYDPDRFESYRQLGEHLIDSVVHELPAAMREELSHEADRSYLNALIQRMNQSDVEVTVQDDQEIDGLVQQAATTLENRDASLDDRQAAATVLSSYLDRPAAVRALIGVVGDPEGMLANLALNILRDVSLALISEFNNPESGLNDTQAAVRERVCDLLADLLLEAEPPAAIVTRLIEIAKGGRGVRKGERRSALHALNACQKRIVNKDDQQTVQDLVNAAATTKAAATSSDD